MLTGGMQLVASLKNSVYKAVVFVLLENEVSLDEAVKQYIEGYTT